MKRRARGVLHSETSWRQYIDTMYQMEWDDFDDFWEKYGPINNPEAYAKLNSLWWTYSEIGMLVYNGLLDMSNANMLLGLMPRRQYQKWEPILSELRKLWGSETAYIHFDYLATRMIHEWESESAHAIRMGMVQEVQRFKASIASE